MAANCPKCRKPFDRQSINGSTVSLQFVSVAATGWKTPVICCPHTVVPIHGRDSSMCGSVKLFDDLTLKRDDFVIVTNVSLPMMRLPLEEPPVGLLLIRTGAEYRNRSFAEQLARSQLALEEFRFRTISEAQLTTDQRSDMVGGLGYKQLEALTRINRLRRDHAELFSDLPNSRAEYLKLLMQTFLPTDNGWYHLPEIPAGQLNKALQTYAPGVTADQVILLNDSTIFSTGSEGCLITSEALFYHRSRQKWRIPWEMVKAASFRGELLKVTMIDGYELPLDLYDGVDRLEIVINQIGLFNQQKNAAKAAAAETVAAPIQEVATKLAKPVVEPVANEKKIRFKCPHCAKTINAPQKLVGKSRNCPGCNQPLQVPEPSRS